MCRRGIEKSPFQAPLGPDSGTKTGAVFWHSKRCRFWSQLARFLARPAPRFRVPIGFVFGRGVRSIGGYTSGLRQPQVQALQGSLEQTSALCGGPARADRGEPSSSWPDPLTERNPLMGIAVPRRTGAAARCASEAARSTAKASRRWKKEQAATVASSRFRGHLAAPILALKVDLVFQHAGANRAVSNRQHRGCEYGGHEWVADRGRPAQWNR
jgi:hypothetical protein